MQSRATPSGWYADPQGRFEYRYFNGVQWTSDVAVDGKRYVDTLVDRPAPPNQPPRRSRGMAIASFVTGLAGVLVGWVPFIFALAACSAIVAIVFGIIGLKTSRRYDGYGRALAVAGLALAPVALAVCVGGFFLTKAVVREFRDFIEPGPHELVVEQPCTVAGGRATLNGTIRNVDDHGHDYRIVVEFTSSESTGSSTVTVPDVAAGAMADWSASAEISRKPSHVQGHRRVRPISIRHRRTELIIASRPLPTSRPRTSASTAPPATKQLGVGTVLHEASVLEHQHPVGAGRGRQAVGNRHGRASGSQLVERPADAHLGEGVDRRCRLVEHQHVGVDQRCPHQCHQLTLAGRQLPAARADLGGEAVGQASPTNR